jgi:excisionase family DNA binding protein
MDIMDDLLTTRQVQDILKVDRITIYRMLQDGRIKGVKVGQQWRFMRREVERMLDQNASPSEAEILAPHPVFPTHCVQTIQDLFSDIGQIGALVIDQEGEPVTQVSHPCAFCKTIMNSAAGQNACRKSWKKFVQQSAAGSKYFTCHAGLQYIGAPITDRGEQVGLFLTGQFYGQLPIPREEADRINRLAAAYDIPQPDLEEAAGCIPVIAPEKHDQVESWPFTAARAVQSILNERTGFVERLQKIANLTQLS